MPEWKTVVLSMVLFCSSECDFWPLHQDLCVLITVYVRRTEDGVSVRQLEAERRLQLQTGSDISGVNGRLPRELITEHFQSVFIQLCLSTSLHVNHKTASERWGLTAYRTHICKKENMDILLYFTKSCIGTKAQKDQQHVQTDVAVTAAGNNQISWFFTHSYSYYLETSTNQPFPSF